MPVLIIRWAVVFWLIVLCVHDLRGHVLPNRLTVPAGIASIAMGCTDPQVALSIVVLCVPYLVSVFAGACGGGDLKLAVGVGGLMADPALAMMVALGAAVATLATGLLRGGTTRRTGVAHGPALAAAAITLGGVWV